IETTRRIQPSAGNIGFSFKSLRNDLGGIQKLLKSNVYKTDAIVPASYWVKSKKPAAPKAEIKKDADKVKIIWQEQGKIKAFWIVVYAKDKNGWSYSILPSATKSIALSADRRISQIVVTSVDRLGNESPFRQLILKQ
ncbi:MAG: hypothetical protein M3Q33_02750, partial [Acidobacteriota bacterium]|nr:hypothetical protein [Acidobacteriota bacterium]